MEPYYADESVTLYHGDSREVIEWLAADVLVTDPPYGRKFRAPESRSGNVFFGDRAGIAGDEDTAVRDSALANWGNRPAIIFGDLALPPMTRVKQTLVYRKPGNAGHFGMISIWRRDAEAIYLTGKWPTTGCVTGGHSSIITTGARHTRLIGGDHPHSKPLDVMETLIAACPDGIVADPFAGSGSTLVAGRNLGRKAIGVEIDERYCELAARRLSQGILEVPVA